MNLSNIKFYLDFYKAFNEKTEAYNNLDFIKVAVYKEVGIQSLLKNSTLMSNSSSKIEDHNFYWNFIYKQFLYTVWVSSDLFYWIIYFAAFTPPKYFVRDKSDRSNLSVNSSTINTILDSFKISAYNFFTLIDDYEQYIETHFNMFRLFNLMKKVLNFKIMFRIFSLICLIGAFLKFFFNLKNLILSLTELILIEDYLKNNS